MPAAPSAVRRPRAFLQLVSLLCVALLAAAPLAGQKTPSGARPAPPAASDKATTSRQGLSTLPSDPEAARRPPQAPADDVCPERPGDRSICYSHIDAEYSVLGSGTVMVTERHTIRFNGSWNGMTRMLREEATAHDFDGIGDSIPDPRRAMRHVEIEVLGATDGAGNPLQVDEERSGWDLNLRVWVPGAADAVRTVILRYRIEDGVTFFSDHDEFYWDVMGAELTAPVAAMDVRVVLPEGADSLRAAALAGAAGSQERNATARVDGPMLVYRLTEPLYPGNGFTIAAGWNEGVVERPSALDRALGWLGRYWGFALPVLSLGLMWSMWSRRGRDPAMLPIVTQYDPPDTLTPGEVGTLLDERADMRDVTATLVDLAVQGRIRIDEVEGTKLLGMEFGEDYRFVQTTPAVQARPMKPHEQRLMDALFGSRSEIELSDLKNEFYKDLPGIREAMMEALVGQGVYTTRPDKVRASWVVGAIAAGIALFFLMGFLPTTAASAVFTVPVLTALPIMIFGWLMPSRTVRGTRMIERLRGFREFLERVDGDRLRRMSVDPSMFERLLPFAMAFGVEKKWAEAFEGLAQEPPNWYRSRHGGPFRPVLFASSMSRMSTATASTMASSPKSSSGGGGSGFSGGGSVGGGGGGGGVGGF